MTMIYLFLCVLTSSLSLVSPAVRPRAVLISTTTAIRFFLKSFQLEHTGIDMIGQQDLYPDDLLGKAQHRDAFNPRFVQNGLGRNRFGKGRSLNQSDFFLAFFDDKIRFIAGVNHHSRMIRGQPSA